MENKQYLDETGLSEVGKVISKFYASKDDLNKIDVTSQLGDYAKKTEIPTKLSELQSDTNNRAVSDAEKNKLANIEDGAEKNKVNSVNNKVGDVVLKISDLENDKTFKTEAEIQSMINNSTKLKKEVVTSFPNSGKDDVIYLLKNKNDENNVYTEYLWIGDKWEIIGDTKVDLTGYVEKVEGKGLSTNDFSNEKLETFEKMELEQKRLDIITELKNNDMISHESTLLTGDYGLVSTDRCMLIEDYNNIFTREESAHILEKIKKHEITIPELMQLTVTKKEHIEKDGSKTYQIFQNLYDPVTKIAFGIATKNHKKEYSDEEILKKINIENILEIENIVPKDDWYPWGLYNTWEIKMTPVRPGKLTDGYSCGLMRPDDKLKLDSIDVEAINSIISNSNNNNTVKFCDVEKEVLSKGADAPIGFYIDNTEIGNALKIYRIFIDKSTQSKSYRVEMLPLSYDTLTHGSSVYLWQNGQWEKQLSGPPTEEPGSIADEISRLQDRIAKLESKVGR